jgi:hypothetical protein
MRQSLFKDAFHETEFLTTEKTVILILNDSLCGKLHLPRDLTFFDRHMTTLLRGSYAIKSRTASKSINHIISHSS